MRPLFTIHAGEYLVGAHIEQRFPKLNVWIPSRDRGVDFLVTDAANRRTVSLQVKSSKDFVPTHFSGPLQRTFSAAGWWTHEEQKLAGSKADLWVFVLPSFTEKRTHFIILPPSELLRRLKAIHGPMGKRIQSYLWVTRSGRCWEARGLKKAELELVTDGSFEARNRDFSEYLDNWREMVRRLD